MTINTNYIANSPIFGVAAAAGENQMDGTQATGDLMNNFWEAMQLIQHGSADDANVKMLMESVNALKAFFAQAGNTPSYANNPATYRVYEMIENLNVGSDTLASLSAQLGTATEATAVQTLESGNWQGNISALILPQVNNWYPSGWRTQYTQNSLTSPLYQDLQALYADLPGFGSRPSTHLSLIAADLTQVLADIKATPITDGYLLPVNNFLVGNGLDKLVAAYNTVPQPPDAAANLLAALTSTTGGTTPLYKDMQSMMKEVAYEEYSQSW